MQTLKIIVLALLLLIRIADATTIDKSFTAVGVGGGLAVKEKGSFSFSLSGTFVGTAVLERTINGGISFEAVTTASGVSSGTVTVSTSGGGGATYRWRCSARTSGTLVTSLIDVAVPVQDFLDSSSNLVFRISEDGITVPGITRTNGPIDLAQIATPVAPVAGRNRFYCKSDDSCYVQTSAGAETIIGGVIGGFPIASLVTGDILYADSAGHLARLPAGSNGQFLTLAAGIPSWATTGVSFPLYGTDGSAAANTYGFASDHGTGMYLAGGAATFSKASVDVARFTTIGTVAHLGLNTALAGGVVSIGNFDGTDQYLQFYSGRSTTYFGTHIGPNGPYRLGYDGTFGAAPFPAAYFNTILLGYADTETPTIPTTGTVKAKAAFTINGASGGVILQDAGATIASATSAGVNVPGLTASQAVVTDGSKNLASLAYASANTASALVQRDGSGNFAAGTITANLTGNASGTAATFTGNLTGDVTSSGMATTLAATSNATLATLSRAAGVAIHGTNTNDDAAADYAGEYLEDDHAAAADFPAATTVWGDCGSKSTGSGGDFEVSAQICSTLNGSVMTSFDWGIGSASGTGTTGLSLGKTWFQSAALPVGTVAQCGEVTARYSVAASTTLYFKCRAAYTVATPQYVGGLRIRRVR